MTHATPLTTPAPQFSFLGVAEHFSPAWFAAVMGTGVIPLAISFIDAPWVRPVASAFQIIAIAMFVLAIGPWASRFFLFPKQAKKDLNHPIAANFLPTMPIALIVIALGFLKYPGLLVSAEASLSIAFTLWILGAVGIYVMGFIILIHIFRHQNIKMEHANFGWYIPPVSKLIIPVGGFEIAERMPQHFDLAFGLSIISLGVGFFLFLFVGAAVYHRYIYHELLVSKLAPTFFVGITPTAIIAVDLFKLHHLIEHAQPLGLTIDSLGGVLKLAILMNWGLALWWFIMALALTSVYLRTVRIPYALSWWAFTFPTGALAVSTGVAWRVTGFAFAWWIYLFIIGFLLIIWLLVAVRTAQGVISRKVFLPAH